jgi:hypothetical protein
MPNPPIEFLIIITTYIPTGDGWVEFRERKRK